MIKKEKNDIIIYESKIASNFEAVDRCVNEILNKMSEFEALKDEELIFRTSFVLRELLNNSVEHGNKFDENKDIDCLVLYSPPHLKIEIVDEGEGFEIDQTYYEALENDHRNRRRGLKLVEALDFELIITKNKFKLHTHIEERG
jgi:serine/threonine-protein kinase RsbW